MYDNPDDNGRHINRLPRHDVTRRLRQDIQSQNASSKLVFTSPSKTYSGTREDQLTPVPVFSLPSSVPTSVPSLGTSCVWVCV